MSNEHTVLVYHWYKRAIELWIISKVQLHELYLEAEFHHFHILSLEMIMKAVILMLEKKRQSKIGITLLNGFQRGIVSSN